MRIERMIDDCAEANCQAEEDEELCEQMKFYGECPLKEREK